MLSGKIVPLPYLDQGFKKFCSSKSYFAELNGQDRLCLVCDAVMELDSRTNSMAPGAYSVDAYMQD